MIVAALGLTVAAAGIVTVSISVRVSSLAIIAVPTAIIGAVVSGLSVAVTALFLRDKLCKIAFFINIGALSISVVSIIIWLAAL